MALLFTYRHRKFAGRIPTEEEIRRKEDEVFLTERSLKDLLKGKIIYDDDGRIWIHPPSTNELGIMRTKKKLKKVI